MRVERFVSPASMGDPSDEQRMQTLQDPMTNAAPMQMKAAPRQPANRVQQLRELADKLLKETETLARDNAFAEESNRMRSLDLEEGIDFYDEVQRFETSLIRLALDQTHGHQARAARLLRIKPTTLNSKIKLYGIEY